MNPTTLQRRSGFSGPLCLGALLLAWVGGSAPAADPLAYALSKDGQIDNREAVIPSQCYTKTDGISNPCWTCHTTTNGLNLMGDWELQEEYAFSDEGLTNHWTNLFADRSAAIARISDAEILAYIREDNYSPLRDALADRADYPGWRPDLDYSQGFDDDSFAADGTWWRAFRYKPFLGTFWPTNGSTDDVLIRLPAKFWKTSEGVDSYEIYKVNLAILETAIAIPGEIPSEEISHTVEPINEELAGIDLNADGQVGGLITKLSGLPLTYVGAAADERVQRHLYPVGTEFLHTVRYVDPDSPTLLSARMKEVRYSRKTLGTDPWLVQRAYEEELDAKDIGLLPKFAGSALVGLSNDFGWLYQGFIEDADGNLRLQTDEEHSFCMGCHSTIGATADQSFGFPRKVPGANGWGHQDITGIPDVPQSGMDRPEILTYFRRVGGGDEFRANDEILSRFFPGGMLDEHEVMRAAPGGDRDIAWLIVPSYERALLLNKAYRALILEQTFELGRDAVIEPTANVHRSIVNGSTDLDLTGQIYTDGRIWLDWSSLIDRQRRSESVQSAYIAYYGRPADTVGRDYWIDRLAAENGNLDALVEQFYNSEEADLRFGGKSHSELLDELYLQLFGRAPDPGGKDFYLDALSSGSIALENVILDVLKGAQNEDAIIVAHKLQVSEYFTEQVSARGRDYRIEDIPAARSVLDAVTMDPDSVPESRTLAIAVVEAMAGL